jgi:hypothetical protein
LLTVAEFGQYVRTRPLQRFLFDEEAFALTGHLVSNIHGKQQRRDFRGTEACLKKVEVLGLGLGSSRASVSQCRPNWVAECRHGPLAFVGAWCGDVSRYRSADVDLSLSPVRNSQTETDGVPLLEKNKTTIT